MVNPYPSLSCTPAPEPFSTFSLWTLKLDDDEIDDVLAAIVDNDNGDSYSLFYCYLLIRITLSLAIEPDFCHFF